MPEEGEDYTEVWVILKFPVVPRDVLADLLTPLVRDAIGAGGELDQLTITQKHKEGEDAD